jgi:voltage-gated potassium channel
MNNKNLRNKLYKIIFKSDTPAGKGFDVLLIISILLSVVVVMLDSVQYYNNKYGDILYIMEWIFTLLFTVEYFLRIYCINRPLIYMRSFFGIIDILSIIPTYISIFFPASRYLSIIRILRVLRIFRVLKLIFYIGEANILMDALVSARRKIIVFLFFIFTLATIIGSVMYLVEGEANGFTSIPRSIYWAIVTITTVGYGDISPQTALGQFFASFAMIIGYATIAVPTGIISAEYSTMKQKFNNTVCPDCGNEDHEDDAKFCRTCGTALE